MLMHESWPPDEQATDVRDQVRDFAKVTIVGMCLTAIAAIGYVDKDVAADNIHSMFDRTGAEVILEDTLEEVFGESIAVRCLNQEEMNPDTSAPGQARSIVLGTTERERLTGLLPVIRLDERLCDEIADYALRPEVRDAPTAKTAASLSTLGHEYDHAGPDVVNESEADCHGVQYAALLAQGLGATLEQAEILRAEAVAGFAKVEITPASTELAPYLIDARCTPGGAHDLKLPGDAFPAVGTISVSQWGIEA